MNERVAIAPVRKTVHVRVPIEHAFEVFTSGLTRWWPLDHTIGKKPVRKVMLEPRLGGRWLEISEDGTETSDATIIAWEPPHRFVMLWQINAQWQPDQSMKSEVDVRFIAEGSKATRVELLHHKFETMGMEAGTAMRDAVERGWPALLQQFADEAERAGP
jgi:uncharacterized protein YndB with AHSA1/START domain